LSFRITDFGGGGIYGLSDFFSWHSHSSVSLMGYPLTVLRTYEELMTICVRRWGEEEVVMVRGVGIKRAV
jgi:hypothetical protein